MRVLNSILLFQSQVDVANHLRTVGCANQTLLFKYMFKARNLHRALREAMRTGNERDQKDAYDRLMYHLRGELQSIVEFHCNEASKLFKCTGGRDRYPMPRCMVKVISGKNEESAHVSTLWGTQGTKSGQSSPLRDNIATRRVFENPRTAYIQNDIPQSLVSGNYENPRINKEKAEKYVRRWFGVRWVRRLKCSADLEWVKCWDNGGMDVTPESTYKSTL
ncbi:MAG: hypothetical protein RRY29_10525, partial [Desulfovibrionaceae bacterium]